jgi:hypothetical protein
MACRGLFLSLSDEQVRRLLAARDQYEADAILGAFIKAEWARGVSHLQETDRAWDAIRETERNGHRWMVRAQARGGLGPTSPARITGPGC